MPFQKEELMMRLTGAICLLLIGLNVSAQEASGAAPKPAQPDLPGDILIDVGFNWMTGNADKLDRHVWGSNSFGVGYSQRFRLGDRLSVYPGVMLSTEKYSFRSGHSWVRDTLGAISFDTLMFPLVEKNKLVATYLDIPLELRIHPLGTVDGEGFFIGLGVIGGMRIGAHTKLKYRLLDKTVKEKLYDDFGLERFRYGLQARLGFKAVHLYYKVWLNDVFKNAPAGTGAVPQAWTLGVNITVF